MSGGERKKKVGMVQAWEEAGEEFFQESYPGGGSEVTDVMRMEPSALSTLLPSKQKRTGTGLKDVNLSTLRHPTTCRTNNYNTTTSAAVVNDISLSCMPDLSENLSNEELLWSEIMKIKALPINMSEKRELKQRLKSMDTLRLKGYKQFKWKRKQSFLNFKRFFVGLKERLSPWHNTLRTIEGLHGTGVASFFFLLKWLIILNALSSVTIFIFIIYPTLAMKSENSFLKSKNENILANSERLNITEGSSSFFWEAILGEELSDTIPLYYSYYENFILEIGNLRASSAFIYATCVVFCLFLCFVAILRSAGDDIQEKLLDSQGQFYVYCNAIFSNWDFCVRNVHSANIKKKAIYNNLVGRLNRDKFKGISKSRTTGARFKLYAIRLIVNCVIIALLVVAGAIIIYVFGYMIRVPRNEEKPLLNLAVQFAPSATIVFFNTFFPFFFRSLTKYERYDPMRVIQILVYRSLVLRLSSLCVLMGSAYIVTTLCDDYKSSIKFGGLRCDAFCWEEYIAIQLYKLLLLHLTMQVLTTFLYKLPRSLIGRRFTNSAMRDLFMREFDIPTHVLDAVYAQTIIWLGCFYAPMLPMIGFVAFIALFYVKKFDCLVNCRPSEHVFHASRSHAMFMFALLVCFAFSIAPFIYFAAEIKPSRICGPFKSYDTAWTTVSETLNSFPIWMHAIARICVSSSFILCAFVALILWIVYYRAVYKANKQMVLVLKKQLILEGHDKQFLLNKLSSMIREQQERGNKNRVRSS